jgi:hypothetical protein
MEKLDNRLEILSAVIDKNRQRYTAHQDDKMTIQPRVSVINRTVQVVRGGEVSLANLCGGPRRPQSRLTGKSRRTMLQRFDMLSDVFTPKYFLCLTYPEEFPKDGRKVKKDLVNLHHFFTGTGTYAVSHDPDIKFFWKMEFQLRGAPHYHIIIDSKLEFKEFFDLAVKKWTSITKNPFAGQWCNHKDVPHEEYDSPGVNCTVIDDQFLAAIYVSLYGSKKEGYQNKSPKDFEHPGRFWGLMGFNKGRPVMVVPGARGVDKGLSSGSGESSQNIPLWIVDLPRHFGT